MTEIINPEEKLSPISSVEHKPLSPEFVGSAEDHEGLDEDPGDHAAVPALEVSPSAPAESHIPSPALILETPSGANSNETIGKLFSALHEKVIVNNGVDAGAAEELDKLLKL